MLKHIWILRFLLLVVLKVLLLATFPIVSSANSSLNYVQPQAEALKEFSQSLTWRGLLYYNSKSISEITSPGFFISPKGSKDPYEELRVSYQQMFHQDKEVINDEHVICKFPARFYVLDKAFKKNEFHKIKYCPKFLAFMNRAAGQSISMVFSAYNLNSPSSAFGHTFLKVNKQNSDGAFDLLNYGINYAANTGGTNPLFYALKGLFGFYVGEFTAVPYYYKIREYNDFESRDIWEYELNLDYEEVHLLTMHFWELGSGWAWYYFLDKNCSYWALKTIGAIATRYNFDDDLDKVLVIPVDTLKSLAAQKDLIKRVNFRPSIHKQLKSSIKNLDRKQKLRVKKIAEDLHSQKIKDKSSLDVDSVEVLDASLLYFDYRFAKDYITQEKETLSKKQPLLLARSQKGKSLKNDVVVPARPESLHPIQRWGLGYAGGDAHQSVKISYKMGFHELYDSLSGMDAALAMNYFDLNLQYYKIKGSSDWKVDLDRFDLIRIDMFSPTDSMDKKMSFRLRVGVDHDLFSRAIDKKVGVLSLDTGASLALDEEQTQLLYFLVSNNLESSARFKNKIRLSIAPLLGIKVHWSAHLATMFEVRHQWYWNLEDVVQRQWSADLKAQYYLTQWASAFYLNALGFDGYTKGVNTNDVHWEVGIRKFY